jgi:hypothetical protein
MATREAILDALLALGEPVQGRIELVLAGTADIELVGERRLPEGARAGQLGARLEQALGDHRHHQRALPRTRAIQHPRQLQPTTSPKHRGDVPVRERALHLERLLARDQDLAGQRAAQRVKRRRRQLGDIRDRLVTDPLALADRAADQVRLIHPLAVSPSDRGYVHRSA